MRKIILFFISGIVLFGCRFTSTLPIEEPKAENFDEHFIGKWMFNEDTNAKNFYEVYKSAYPDQYHVRFWNRGGANPTYEGNMYLSKVGKWRFVNVPYFETDPVERGFKNKGYIFLKVLYMSPDNNEIVTATVNDTTMRALTSRAQVRRRIEQNIDNTAFYTDTAHFFRKK